MFDEREDVRLQVEGSLAQFQSGGNFIFHLIAADCLARLSQPSQPETDLEMT